MHPVVFLVAGFLSLAGGAEIKVLLEGGQDQLNRQERRLANTEVIRIQEIGETIVVQVQEEQSAKGQSKGQSAKKSRNRGRGLVPQLWKNYTGPAETPAENVTCDVASAECQNRAGCGFALENYMLGCMDLIEGESDVCNSHCQHALIALMSTHEGKRLMKCDCQGNDLCIRSKTNVQACQDKVTYAVKPNTQVSCSAARWICAADAPCGKALEYYDQFCRAMFRGRKCTKRCMNSINILRRQAGADKLESCYCDGTEDFPCRNIKSNMDKLCFRDDGDDMSNEIDTGHHSSSGGTLARLHRVVVVVCVFLGLVFQVLLQSLQDMMSGSDSQS